MSVRRTALLGGGISYSLSPALHERAAKRANIDVSYVLLDAEVENLTGVDMLQYAADMRLVGANVTQPFKEVAFHSVDDLDPVAEAVGAVNTIVYGPNGTQGFNTDVDGFGAELDDGIGDIAGGRVVQFGAGGAGAAAAFATLERDVEQLWIIDLDLSKAARLAERMSRAFPAMQIRSGDRDQVAEAMKAATGVINASTMGAAAHPGTPLPPEHLREGMWVADVLYAPAETALLRDARVRGATTVNGGRMLVHQAACSFQLFHHVQPDISAMWADFQSLIAERR